MPFEHVFDQMDVRAAPFALCRLHGQCAMPLGRQARATLHYILSGEGTVRFPNRPSHAVRRGSLIIIPATESHSLRASGEGGFPVPECQPAAHNLTEHVAQGDDPERTGGLLAICSHVDIALRGASGMLDLIREPVGTDLEEAPALDGAVSRLLDELARPRLGGRAMIRAVILQCVIELLRQRMDRGDPAVSWMGGLADQTLWPALKRMLDAPGDAHSVERLAAEAGMSRSSFARHFALAYGAGPMELLRELRMRFAGSLLLETGLPVKRVAALTGFQSRSAFTRAFVGHMGVSPKSFRAGRDQNGEAPRHPGRGAADAGG